MMDHYVDEEIGLTILYINITLSTLFLEMVEKSMRESGGTKTHGALERHGHCYIDP